MRKEVAIVDVERACELCSAPDQPPAPAREGLLGNLPWPKEPWGGCAIGSALPTLRQADSGKAIRRPLLRRPMPESIPGKEPCRGRCGGLRYGNTATVRGFGSNAFAEFGDGNTATVRGVGSIAEAGFGDGNTATAGDNCTAVATGGDGLTASCP
jgi:hypothetical protein